MKVAITTSSFAKFSDAPLQLLRARGIETVFNPHGRSLTEDEAIELLRGCVGVAAGTEPLTARVLAALPELKVISRCGVGMDNVDMRAAAERGIQVRNTPEGPVRSVAELTLAYALNLCRQISLMDRELRGGVWKKRMGRLLGEQRVGIVGFGRIGRAVGALFRGLGCQVAFYDPFPPADPQGCAPMELDELLAWADLVTLHTDKPKDGSLVLSGERIRRMKPGAMLINAARGGILDEDVLAEALRNGDLAGAALDVYSAEPYSGPLAEIPTTILTPHVGSYAREARAKMETDTIVNLLEALQLM